MAAHGADYGFISQWCEAQSGHSWTGAGGLPTCRRKVVQLAARGLNWDPPPPAPGVWYGTGKFDREYQDAVAFYKKNPAQLDKDVETVAQYKAAVQLLMENADFEGNNKTTRSVKLVRTEAKGVVAKKPTIGKAYAYDMGPAESYSWHKTVKAFGEYATVAEIPWSRINAAYFMERTPGLGDRLFLGEDESEFNVDGIGLRRVFCESLSHDKPCKDFYGLL